MTTEEARFLREYEIPQMWIADERQMDDPHISGGDKYYFVRGEPRCSLKHKLQTYAGRSCIQCNPSNIKAVVNEKKNGRVFIAKSASLRLLKVSTL